MSRKIKNALISVSDKANLSRILKTLKKFNVNIISSGGTFKEIKKLGYKNISITKIPNKNIGIAINDRLKRASS